MTIRRLATLESQHSSMLIATQKDKENQTLQREILRRLEALEVKGPPSNSTSTEGAVSLRENTERHVAELARRVEIIGQQGEHFQERQANLFTEVYQLCERLTKAERA